MKNFTIHIFGYGETQVISSELSKKISSNSLTKVKPLVDAIWSKKPKGSKVDAEYHVIHIFNYNSIRFVNKDGFKLDNEENLIPLIDDLILEMKNYVEEPTKTIVE